MGTHIQETNVEPTKKITKITYHESMTRLTDKKVDIHATINPFYF